MRLSERRRRQRRDGGQVIIAFAIMFSLFLLGLIGLVANLGQMYAYDSLLRKTAADAAISGAAYVDVNYFRTTGTVRLIAGTASTQCHAAAVADLGSMASGTTIACNENTDLAGAPQQGAMQVVVTRTVAMPVSLFGGPVTMKRTYAAFAQCGTNTALAAC